jgi:hypothetical protein
MLRFGNQPNQLGDFVIGSRGAGAVEHSYAALGKVALDFFDHRQHGIVSIPNAEENFVVRIVLPAKCREILVGVGIKSAKRLEDAHRRRESGIRCAVWWREGEKSPGAVNDDEVVGQRTNGDEKYEVASSRQEYRASLACPARVLAPIRT